MNNKLNHIVCIDFETGGLDKKEEKHCQLVPVTQLGLRSFRADTFETISTYKTYVQGYDNLQYQQEALDFTGTSMSQINAGIPVEALVKAMVVEFEKANTADPRSKRFYKPILLGHNIQFDIQFLQYIFTRCGVDLSKYLHGAKDAAGNFYPAFYDTMWLARQRFVHEENKDFKLTTICEKLDVLLADAHEAMADVNATCEAYIKLTSSARAGVSATSPEEKKERFRSTFQY